MPRRHWHPRHLQGDRQSQNNNDKFLREVNCMQRLAHSPKVVQLYDALEDEDAYYLIMEWCRGGAIQDYTSSHNLYSENTAHDTGHCVLGIEVVA